ncbi:hypothetical protein CCYS_01065 [Corynebacterium cystitidis DSM 20524]|uniref:Uncharacterized protein n=1 Tax=Corynebacterium cystitidis DSM 20524 TaxID=1121357 RepID=A0A1H9U6Y5_9CORY|nr:hypothetical protein CCYS_01065 [Corynebacterium cystitidis DSM 20524]SES04907.1 hypothetical protein SAMN05661109_01683 [Corynebacterium cystitidis DSM 20524]SNV89517.1 Uncharacterised protein [Corynebacterium cystitidis]
MRNHHMMLLVIGGDKTWSRLTNRYQLHSNRDIMSIKIVGRARLVDISHQTNTNSLAAMWHIYSGGIFDWLC